MQNLLGFCLNHQFFLALGSRNDGSFVFSFKWLRELFKISETQRAKIPPSVRKLLSNQCEVCGSRQNLEIHHKVPLCLGGSDEKGNLKV